MSSIFPSGDEIRSVLATLLGRNVVLRGVLPGTPISSAVFAVYGASEQPASVVLTCDLAFAANAGAALALFPPQSAQDCMASGRLTTPLFENISEILNVCGRLLNKIPGQRLKMSGAYQKKSDLPPEAVAVLEAPTQQLDMAVDVTGYGSGRLSIIYSGPEHA
jgi:hypothetical protein